MVFELTSEVFQLLSIISGPAILILIVLTNVFQFKIMRRFSGVIGKVMFWYSLGLAAMLVLTIFNVLADAFHLSLRAVLLGNQLLFLVVVAFFFKGSAVIR